MIPGLLSGLLWGLDTVMIGVVLAKLGNDFLLAFLAPILSSFIHDAMSAVWLWVITFLRRGIKPLFKVWHSKAAVEVMVAALLGGPIGMTCYVLSIRDLGSGLTALFSAFFPALGAAMGHFFLKQRLKFYQWLSLLVCLGAVAVLSVPTSGGLKITATGLLWAIICVVSWAAESVICAHAMQNDAVSAEQAIVIRQTVSALTYAIIILPWLNAWKMIPPLLSLPSSGFLPLAAICGAFSFILYYRAIHQLGAGRGMALNITYCAWAMVFAAIFLREKPALYQLAAAVVLIIASLVTAGAFIFRRGVSPSDKLK